MNIKPNFGKFRKNEKKGQKIVVLLKKEEKKGLAS